MQINSLELQNTEFPDRKTDMQTSHVTSSRKGDLQKPLYKTLQKKPSV